MPFNTLPEHYDLFVYALWDDATQSCILRKEDAKGTAYWQHLWTHYRVYFKDRQDAELYVQENFILKHPELKLWCRVETSWTLTYE